MKQTKKEIEATLRNKLAKQYTTKIDYLNERIEKLGKELYEEKQKRIEAQAKANELEDKVSQYEDWNRRLQEFMDMNDDDRKNALAEMKANAEMAKIVDMFKHLASPLFY